MIFPLSLRVDRIYAEAISPRARRHAIAARIIRQVNKGYPSINIYIINYDARLRRRYARLISAPAIIKCFRNTIIINTHLVIISRHHQIFCHNITVLHAMHARDDRNWRQYRRAVAILIMPTRILPTSFISSANTASFDFISK